MDERPDFFQEVLRLVELMLPLLPLGHIFEVKEVLRIALCWCFKAARLVGDDKRGRFWHGYIWVHAWNCFKLSEKVKR